MEVLYAYAAFVGESVTYVLTQLVDTVLANDQEFVAWRWEPIRNLPGLIIPFKRPVYERVVKEFARFA